MSRQRPRPPFRRWVGLAAGNDKGRSAYRWRSGRAVFQRPGYGETKSVDIVIT